MSAVICQQKINSVRYDTLLTSMVQVSVKALSSVNLFV